MKKTLFSLGKVLDKSTQQTINGGFGKCPGMCVRYASGVFTCDFHDKNK
ncbi:hypothetical protein [Tenacibaculum amylolyticum]